MASARKLSYRESMRRCVTLAIFSLSVLAGCDKDKVASEAPSSQTPSAGAPDGSEQGDMTFTQALATVSQRHPDAVAIEIEVEEKEGDRLLAVELLVGETITEVAVDPQTRNVVGQGEDEELTDEERSALPALRAALEEQGVTLEQVVEMALARYRPDQIREVELELEGGELVAEVTVAEGGETIEWIHDPKTGESLGRRTAEQSATAPQ